MNEPFNLGQFKPSGIRVFTFPPPPEGHKWKFSGSEDGEDIIAEAVPIAQPGAVDPYADLKAAIAAGKKLQLRRNQLDEWRDGYGPAPFAWCYPPESYRIKPEPKLVPLEAEDIPAVCWLRGDGGAESLVLTVDYRCVDGLGAKYFPATFREMMSKGWEYSTDRKNWKPCSKPEEAK